MWWRRLRYLLVLIALCAIATCPAAKRSCTARVRATEADQLLGYLADRVAAHVATAGRVPPTAAGPTPQSTCCAQGGECSPDPALWDAPGWRELGFSVDGAHRYAYQYTPDPSGLGATLRAAADLDCEGTVSVIEVKLTVAGGKVAQAWSRGAGTTGVGSAGAAGSN
jgi:hypothetical protein